ncbi:MAG: response regulator [Chthoniobacterales bacterium]
MQATILIVEDEPDVTALLRYNLKRAELGVETAEDGAKGLKKAREILPDVIILDVMMPKMNGFELCRELRADSQTRDICILMLTARGEPEERVKGLELGADDYLTKPFSPRELVLRVQALLRRRRTDARPEEFEFEDFKIDKGNFRILLKNKSLELTTIEFKLLTLLIERRGKTQSRQDLLSDVWGYQNTVDTRTVDTHVRRLREKIGEHADRIETIRGEGYRFVTSRS